LQRRHRLLIDSPWQIRVWRATAIAAVAAGTLHLVIGSALLGWIPIDGLGGTDARTLTLVLHAMFFVLLAAVMYVVTLRLTQEVAGPALVMQKAIEGLQRGEYHHRTSLRKGDYLQELAAATAKLAAQLQQRAAREQEFWRELERQLPGEVMARVRALAARHLEAANAPNAAATAAAAREQTPPLTAVSSGSTADPQRG
jgi:hypothetical protein